MFTKRENNIIDAVSEGKLEEVKSLVKYYGVSLLLKRNTEGLPLLAIAAHGIHKRLVEYIEEQLPEQELLKQWKMVDPSTIKNKIQNIYPEVFPVEKSRNLVSYSNINIHRFAEFFSTYKDAPWHHTYENHEEPYRSCMRVTLCCWKDCYREDWIEMKKRLIAKGYDMSDPSEKIFEVRTDLLLAHNRAVVAVQNLLNSFQEKVEKKVADVNDFNPDTTPVPFLTSLTLNP